MRTPIERTLWETGLGVLSLKDVQALGFSTLEYRASIFFEALRERFIQSEDELLEAISNPYATDNMIEDSATGEAGYR